MLEGFPDDFTVSASFFLVNRHNILCSLQFFRLSNCSV